MDERWQQLGNLLVEYSTAVQPGERVMIAMHELNSYPLAHAIYAAVIRAGGLPQIQFLSESLRHLILKFGNADQIAWVPEIEAYGMEWADVYFGLRGAYNIHQHHDIPAERLAASQRAMGQISALRWEKTRWCLLRIPDALFAQQAEVDLETITEMFFKACLLNWNALSCQWSAQAEKLNHGSQVRIVARDTDLTFSVAGRRWMVFDGKINMPDGEIYTAPVTETLNGYIRFNFPGIFAGRLLHDLFFRWEDGRLIEATSATHQEYLAEIVQSDAGASLIGEFAFGLNPHMTLFCKDILFDEKIIGTIHIALGRAYPECGGTNQSAIHWDIVKDLRHDGVIFLDDRIIFEKGKLVI